VASNKIDNGPLTKATGSFYLSKTIQRSYNYVVVFELSDLGYLGIGTTNLYKGSYYATSIEIPNYEFKDEEYRIGSFVKTFPVLEHHGFAFTIKFEEDDQGTIQFLIDVLTKRNIGSNGYYHSYKNAVLNQIVVDVLKPDGTRIYRRTFFNCYFLKSSTPTYSYNTSEKIEYDITFKADHFQTDYEEAVLTDPNYSYPEPS